MPNEEEDGVKARFSDVLSTPWRVVLLGSSPGSLLESELIQNLNDPCALKDVSWIKPGISTRYHGQTGEVKHDNQMIKQYIDLTASERWPYMMIDYPWYGAFNHPEADITQAAPQLDMPGLLRYVKEKNVRLWLWLYSSDVNRNNNFEEALALYEKWGIAGVKIDLMDREDQEIVNWYKKIITKAAEHHLLVDFHGACKPDGIIRTYPNMITCVGFISEESPKSGSRILPEHNVILPFTRMLAGQMDYTPGESLNVGKANLTQASATQAVNTLCAELAKFVIYESLLIVYSDYSEHMLNQAEADFLKLVPTVWDDIHVISGYPGEHIALVKRSGNNFFIGAMTNNITRSLKIKLNFLPKGIYQLTSWEDAKGTRLQSKKVVKSRKIVNSRSVINVKMAGSGGYVAELRLITQ